mgnify:CR=1 FL=1
MSTSAVCPLPRTSPESQGLASDALLALVDALEARCPHVHSLMVLRRGQVVAEGWWAPYRRDERHMLFSLSKSFCSTAAGFAVAEGRLSLDDYVTSFFPDDLPADISANLAAMRVRHLLSMSIGHSEDTLSHIMRGQESNWAKVFLGCPVTHTPGTFFLYNSGATYMVSAIVQSVTGQKIVDYLQPRLFDPLGIAPPVWDECPRGINTGGWGLNVTTEDIARFGQLYLQDGLWQGERVLPAGWVAEATRRHVSNGTDPESDWAQGYGFQFWRCRHNAYRGDGAFGQLCLVLPEAETVVAMTSGLADFQGLLNCLWDHLLPALAIGEAARPDDRAAQQRLAAKLDSLMLPAPAGAASSPLAAAIDGTVYELEPNEQGLSSVRFDLAARRLVFSGADGLRETEFAWDGAWRDGMSRWPAPSPGPTLPQKAAASAAWLADNTLAVAICGYSTPSTLTLTATFEGDALTLAQALDFSFGPTAWPDLKGRRTPA